MSIKRLLRESNPPAGMLASPVPQYEDVSTGEPGAVKGRYGAPFSMLLGPDGQPIDPSNPLEVRVRELETELQELRQLLQSGDTKVQLTGSSVPMRYLVIDYGDVEIAGIFNIFGSSFSTAPSGAVRDTRRMLDVSLYRKVMIRIENKSDNAVSVGNLYFGIEPDSVFGDSVKSISVGNIPALATVWLAPWEGDDVVYMPELASGFPSLGMWSWPGPSLWGTVNVKVWGWN